MRLHTVADAKNRAYALFKAAPQQRQQRSLQHAQQHPPVRPCVAQRQPRCERTARRLDSAYARVFASTTVGRRIPKNSRKVIVPQNQATFIAASSESNTTPP